jgi:predicted transposase/invertase (TIGR01784 family)
LISEADKRILLEHMERLYRELFAQYTEFKEADVMLRDRILTYSEEAARKAAKKAKLEKAFNVAKKMLERGMALPEIAEIVELPVDTLQTLVPNS